MNSLVGVWRLVAENAWSAAGETRPTCTARWAWGSSPSRPTAA